ncbi:YjcZ family sporulation protein [Bacillus sp. 165]|nr:YjcZ family sporulation protein [Bacillus sp. 165]
MYITRGENRGGIKVGNIYENSYFVLLLVLFILLIIVGIIYM